MSAASVPLGDVATFLSGFAFKSEKFNSDGRGLPIVRIRDVVRGKSNTYFDGDFDSRYLVEDGDYLIGMDGEFNLAPWRGGSALLNQRVCKLDKLRSDIDRAYVAKFLPLALKKIEEATPFVTVKHLSVKDLNEIELPLPTLEEQRRIAAILDQAEELRAKRRAAIALLDQLPQAIFLEMFGDPAANPMSWSNGYHLADFADLVSGITKGRKLNGQAVREIPYMAVINVQDKHLNLDSVKSIEATEAEIHRYRLKRDDLLLTEGGDPDKLGRGTLWNDELPEAIHQNHVFRVRLTSDKLSPLYLSWLIGSSYGKSYFLRQAKQTTGIATINMGQLKAFPLLLPPATLQIQFAKRVQLIHRAKTAHQSALAELDALFSSLQSEAFDPKSTQKLAGDRQ